MLLQELNDYCLTHIFECLDLKHQCVLKSLRPNFKTLITGIWRRKYDKTISCKDMALRYVFENDAVRFRDFLDALNCNSIEKLVLNDSEQLLSVFALSQPLTKLKTLKATFSENDSNDSDWTHRANNNTVAEQFPALEHLELHWCDNHYLDAKRVADLTKLLYSDTVTELCLHADIMQALMCSHMLTRMKGLRKFSVCRDHHRYVPVILMQFVNSPCAERLHTFSYNYEFRSYTPYDELLLFRNLRRLHFIGTMRWEDEADLERALSKMPNLLEVYFRSRQMNGAGQLEDCKKIISICRLAVINNEQRKVPLKLYCYAPCDKLRFQRDIFLPPMLKLFVVNSIDGMNAFPCPLYIALQCEWD